MSKESCKDRTKEVKRAAFIRGVARTLDMGAVYSHQQIDTSPQAAYQAVARDVGKIGRDMTKVVGRTILSSKKHQS